MKALPPITAERTPANVPKPRVAIGMACCECSPVGIPDPSSGVWTDNLDHNVRDYAIDHPNKYVGDQWPIDNEKVVGIVYLLPKP